VIARVSIAVWAAVFGAACEEEPPPPSTPFGPGQVVTTPEGDRITVGPNGVVVEQASGDRAVVSNSGAANVQTAQGDTIAVDSTGSVVIENAPVPGGAGNDTASAIARMQDMMMRQAGIENDGTRIRCSSGHVMRIGDTIEGGDEPAIVATGSCTVVCQECTLQSKAEAIIAEDRAHVTAENAHIIGGPTAIAVRDRASVTIRGARVEGEIETAPRAELVR
jgi:hypothetical protein